MISITQQVEKKVKGMRSRRNLNFKVLFSASLRWQNFPLTHGFFKDNSCPSSWRPLRSPTLVLSLYVSWYGTHNLAANLSLLMFGVSACSVHLLITNNGLNNSNELIHLCSVEMLQASQPASTQAYVYTQPQILPEEKTRVLSFLAQVVNSFEQLLFSYRLIPFKNECNTFTQRCWGSRFK